MEELLQYCIPNDHDGRYYLVVGSSNLPSSPPPPSPNKQKIGTQKHRNMIIPRHYKFERVQMELIIAASFVIVSCCRTREYL